MSQEAKGAVTSSSSHLIADVLKGPALKKGINVNPRLAAVAPVALVTAAGLAGCGGQEAQPQVVNNYTIIVKDDESAAAVAKVIGSDQSGAAPVSQEAPKADSELTLTADALKAAGIELDFEGLPSDWPLTSESAAKLLGGEVKVENLVPAVWTSEDGKKHWSGEWLGEMWNLKDGVTFDSNSGVHRDAQGNVLTDIQQIFDFSQKPQLTNIALKSSSAALYAGRGGETANGLPPYTGYFAGTEGAQVEQIEQLTILRPETECIPEEGANLRAYRQAMREFRDNPGARDGWDDNGTHRFRDIQWFNPETGAFQTVQGRLIAEMAKAGIEMPFIEKVAAGYPLTGQEMSSRVGGSEAQWVFDPNTAEWNWEAWDLKPGVNYVPGVGHFDAQGHILVGWHRADAGSDLSIFDFQKGVNHSLLVNSVRAPGDRDEALFVRVGGDSTADKHPQSIYTSGKGDVTIDATLSTMTGAEQMKYTNEDGTVCIPGNGLTAVEQRNMTVGQQEKTAHPDFIVRVWNGSTFVTLNN